MSPATASAHRQPAACAIHGSVAAAIRPPERDARLAEPERESLVRAREGCEHESAAGRRRDRARESGDDEHGEDERDRRRGREQTSRPARAPPVTRTRRSPSRSAATPAGYDPRQRPSTNAETNRLAPAADSPASVLMKPVSVGRPWSTIEMPVWTSSAAASSCQAFGVTPRGSTCVSAAVRPEASISDPASSRDVCSRRERSGCCGARLDQDGRRYRTPRLSGLRLRPARTGRRGPTDPRGDLAALRQDARVVGRTSPFSVYCGSRVWSS